MTSLLYPSVSSESLKALHIPTHEYPYILTDTLTNLKLCAFLNNPIGALSFDEDNVIVLFSSNQQDQHYNSVNFLATTLLTAMYPFLLNDTFIISGSVLFLGIDTDSNFVSVPRKVIDYSMNLMTRYLHGKKV